MSAFVRRKKKKTAAKKKRLLDPNTIISYKDYEGLKRFITDRGKILPRRISGASSHQQKEIKNSVKVARYLGLLPFSLSHRQEKKMIVDAALASAAASMRMDRRPFPGAGGSGGFRPRSEGFDKRPEGGDRSDSYDHRDGGSSGGQDE